MRTTLSTNSLCTLTIALGMMSLEARADCNPRDFVEITDIQRSPETELAFVLTASQHEYDRIKSRGGLVGTYGLISGSKTFQEAQDRARAIAQATKFDYRSSYATNYFSQHLAPAGYLECLEKDKVAPGLRLWLNRREGDFLFFGAFWVGSDSSVATAEYDVKPLVDGGKIISSPPSWTKGKTEELVVKKEVDDQDVFLNLRVGGQSKSIVIVKEPPRVVWNTTPVKSPLLMRTGSHGPNPGCSAGQVSDCIYPTRPGGAFVPGSRAITERSSSDPSTFGEDFYIDRPNQVCVKMTQSTGACEVSQSAQGRLMALERYPEAAE